MIRRLFGELPHWAKPQHPLLRYELYRTRGGESWTARIFRIASWVIFLTFLVMVGYGIATERFQTSAGFNPTEAIWRTLFIPLLGLQIVVRLMAISLGIGAISDERQRQTWDNMRATEHGAELTLRTRWVAMFYRMRGLMVALMAARVVLLGTILFELTAFRGTFLDILVARSDPPVSLFVGVVLLAATLTAAFLMPISAIGVDIAIGLWISTTIKQRAFGVILQILVIAARVIVFAALLYGVLIFLNGDWQGSPSEAWALLGAWSAFGDWGITLLQLSQTGQLIWSQVPYSIFYGVLLLLVMIVQVSVASGLLTLAMRAAERRE